MRSRYPSSSGLSYSFGPGPLTPAIKALVIANVAVFLLTLLRPNLVYLLGLRPVELVGRLQLWEPLTYMFVHGGLFHLLFNMLALWMFGVELERMWGTRYFLKYYFATGVGAAIITTVLAFMPGAFGDALWGAVTIGASGAVYGILLAYGLYFPTRPIYLYFVFPIQAKYFVMIIGGISLISSVTGSGGGIAHVAHLGGLAVGYVFLKGGRFHPLAEIKYRYLRWKINRMRRKFDIYSGGRGVDDVNRRIH